MNLFDGSDHKLHKPFGSKLSPHRAHNAIWIHTTRTRVGMYSHGDGTSSTPQTCDFYCGWFQTEVRNLRKLIWGKFSRLRH